MEREEGVTRVSIANFKELFLAHGLPAIVACDSDSHGNYNLYMRFRAGAFHTFTGFSWGYFGEGPRGLLYVMELLGAPMHVSESIYNCTQEQPYHIIYDSSGQDEDWQWSRIPVIKKRTRKTYE